VGYDARGARDLLVLDPASGEVLAYQHTAIPARGTTARPLPAEQYVLYLSRDRTAGTGLETRLREPI